MVGRGPVGALNVSWVRLLMRDGQLRSDAASDTGRLEVDVIGAVAGKHETKVAGRIVHPALDDVARQWNQVGLQRVWLEPCQNERAA